MANDKPRYDRLDTVKLTVAEIAAKVRESARPAGLGVQTRRQQIDNDTFELEYGVDGKGEFANVYRVGSSGVRSEFIGVAHRFSSGSIAYDIRSDPKERVERIFAALFSQSWSAP